MTRCHRQTLVSPCDDAIPGEFLIRHRFVTRNVYVSARIVTEARKRTSPTSGPITGTSVAER
jgi:hypothetical protein